MAAAARAGKEAWLWMAKPVPLRYSAHRGNQGMRYEEDDWNEGHPVPVTIIGIAAILAAGLFGLPMLPPAPPIYVMGAAIAAAVAIWAIGYAITIRHASSNAKLLSFLLLVGAAIGISYYATAYLTQQRIKADMRTLGEMQIGPSGYPTFPAGAENNGPLSKLYVGFIREMADGQRALDAEAQSAGLQLLSDASALHANPALLANCGKIASIKTMAHAMLERRRERFRALVKAIAEVDYPEAFKRGMNDSIAAERTDANIVRLDALQGQILDAAQGACTVLARRRWVPQGPVFMFNNTADLESFSTFGQRQNQANAEFQRLQMESMARVRDSQRSINQAIGPRPR